jgi:hypothetical protein
MESQVVLAQSMEGQFMLTPSMLVPLKPTPSLGR